MDKKTEEKMQRLIKITSDFCDAHIDKEYKMLCEKLINKMARKRNVPFLFGSEEVWAAGIIHVLGRINFLFDKSFKPYVSAGDISKYFGVSKSTAGQKAKVIGDMLKLSYWDDEFSTEKMKEKNPFKNLVTINGFIVDKTML